MENGKERRSQEESEKEKETRKNIDRREWKGTSGNRKIQRRNRKRQMEEQKETGE